MANATVYNSKIKLGQVAEVVIIPSEGSIYKNLTIAITGERNGLIRKETAYAKAVEGNDTLGPYAAGMRDKFIPWLASNYLEFGIISNTKWIGTVTDPRSWGHALYFLFRRMENVPCMACDDTAI